MGPARPLELRRKRRHDAHDHERSPRQRRPVRRDERGDPAGQLMQWYEQVAQILLIGIANGSLVALVALGYTLVYGIIELINFAHGDVFMIGTMLALTIVTWVPRLIGVNQPYLMSPPMILLTLILSLLASMIVCGLLNVTIERLAYRPLRQAPRLAPLISAIGVSFILINIGLHWKGASPLDFPNLFPNIDIFRDLLKITTPV